VEANIDCQIDCHGGCSAELQGGCEIDCQSPEGALFCDGQYVDHNGNLESCINGLNAFLTSHVDASASANCDDSGCHAEASATCGSVAALGADTGLPWYAALVGAFGVVALRRRRRS